MIEWLSRPGHEPRDKFDKDTLSLAGGYPAVRLGI